MRGGGFTDDFETSVIVLVIRGGSPRETSAWEVDVFIGVTSRGGGRGAFRRVGENCFADVEEEDDDG